KLAEFQAGAAHNPTAKLRRLGVKAGFFQYLGQRLDVFFAHIQKEQFFHRGGAHALDAKGFCHLGDSHQLLARGVPNGGFYAHVEVAILLLVHADVVAVAHVWDGRNAILERRFQVFIFEYLTEFLNSPLRNEEFEASAVAQAAETVVAEDRDHAVPDLWDSLQWDEGADRLRQHRVGG